MSEATHYVVENIEKSYEIYQSLVAMDTHVLASVQKAVENHFCMWLGTSWKIEKGCLSDRYNLYVYPEVLEVQVGKDVCGYLEFGFELEGNDPIWTFFGLPSVDNSDAVYACLYLGHLKDLPNGEAIIETFDDTYREALKKLGFFRKGGKSTPYYSKELIFSNATILEGLRDNAWEQALQPLQSSWCDLDKLIDWEALESQVLG